MLTKRCTTCHLERPLSDFNVRRSSPDGLQPRCRACAREWYVENKARHVANVRARNARVRSENQQRVAEHLLKHPCVDCGETDVRVLDFDHEDPARKTAEIGRLVTCGLPWARIADEIAKCSIRCANCHRRRTAGVDGWWRTEVEERRRAGLLAGATQRLTAALGG